MTKVSLRLNVSTERPRLPIDLLTRPLNGLSGE